MDIIGQNGNEGEHYEGPMITGKNVRQNYLDDSENIEKTY